MLTKRERWLMVQAFRAGYSRGHTDTAGGCYNGVCERENDCAFEWIDDMAAQEIERGGKAEMSNTAKDSIDIMASMLNKLTEDEKRHLNAIIHASREQLERENAELRKKLADTNTVIAKQTNALTHARGALTRISEYDAFGGYQGAMFLARGAIGKIDETMNAKPPL